MKVRRLMRYVDAESRDAGEGELRKQLRLAEEENAILRSLARDLAEIRDITCENASPAEKLERIEGVLDR
jgi:hypothetical protein